MKNKNIQLYLGDSKEILKRLPSNSIDCIVTDPPYGYSFMGKDWDKVLPSQEIWKECLRVLKPGAFAFIMSAPRQDVLSRMMIRLEETGFKIDFSSIYWTYASGFPKASNISKLVDKQECKKKLEQKLRRKPTKKEFEEAWENYRKVIKERPTSVFKVEDGWHNSPMNNPENIYKYTEATSPQAKELAGSYGGFQPKPAVEVIIVAMKPLSEKSYVDQALKNGKGITWLDNCRIPYENEKDKNNAIPQGKITTKDSKSGIGAVVGGINNIELDKEQWKKEKQKGRFPANLLVSDDIFASRQDKGTKPHKVKSNTKKYDGWGSITKKQGEIVNYGDSGSYSRYFDLDKWWEERTNKLPESVKKVFPFLIVPKPSRKEKNKGLENFKEQKVRGDYTDSSKLGLLEVIQNSPRPTCKNFHPTVKPIKLMSYLITLGSREGDIILDPFMGSGTTGISAKLLKRKFIGIELSEEYMKIAIARIKGWEVKDE